MTAAASRTAIFNKAIVLLGSRESLLSHDEPIPSAQSLTALWDIARRSALALHPFNFAIARKKLLPDTVAPEFGYDRRFKLPAECIRWLPWDSDDEFFFDGEEEGGYLLANDPEIYIRFIADHDDPPAWSALFVDIMAYQLAAEYCEAKTGLKGLRQSFLDERDDKIAKARRADGLATGKRGRRRSPSSSRWAGARYRNGVLGR